MSDSMASIDLATLISIMPGHVYWKNTDGVYLGCNQLQAESIGFSDPKKIIGKTDHDFSPPEVVKTVIENDQKVFGMASAISVEEKGIFVNGLEALFLSTKVPIFDSEKKVIGLLGISFDITERKKEQQNSEATLKQVLALLPGHVFWQDKNNVFLGCNKLQAQSAGFTSAEMLIGKSNYEIFSQKEADALNKINKQVVDTGKEVTLEEPGTYEDGEQRYFLSKKAPFKDSNNNTIGVLGVAFDITAEKNAEQLKKEHAIAKERIQTMELLSAAIAHEMRTPLGAIGLAASGLERILPDIKALAKQADTQNLPAMLRKMDIPYLEQYAQTLKETVQGANNFINMLLQHASKASSRAFSVLSMVDSIEHALSQYPESALGGVNIIFDGSTNFEFKGELEFFTHLMFNLIKNACFYVLEAGKGDIHVWTQRGKDYNLVHFKDTGTGMPAEVTARIFDHFFTKTRHGTGVGLAYCKMVMEDLGGDMTCESVKGEYTHFILHFPVLN
jgi:two-component system aerobic respiration control sensor histidine kinase ArcB